MDQWRVIDDQPTLGATNMAVDEAILIAVGAGAAPPTLRLYGWRVPCLSIGYGQRARDADGDRLAALGWGMVRRLTGGRAILHADELTYSVCVPMEHPLAQIGLIESYRQISAALIAALERLGASVRADRAEKSDAPPSPVCFETPSHYEITVNGRKLVGSAQVRRKQALLQHGTLPLTGDITRIVDALAYTDETAREAARALVGQRAITLENALDGRVIAREQAAQVVAESFAQVFQVDLVAGGLAEVERAHADQLARAVYGHDDWTFRR